MTLNCSACNCIHNNSGTCYAGQITISGSHSSKSSIHIVLLSQKEKET